MKLICKRLFTSRNLTIDRELIKSCGLAKPGTSDQKQNRGATYEDKKSYPYTFSSHNPNSKHTYTLQIILSSESVQLWRAWDAIKKQPKLK